MNTFKMINEIVRSKTGNKYGIDVVRDSRDNCSKAICLLEESDTVGIRDKLEKQNILVDIVENGSIPCKKRFKGYMIARDREDINSDVAQSKYVELINENLTELSEILLYLTKEKAITNNIAINRRDDKFNIILEVINSEDELVVEALKDSYNINLIIKGNGFINKMMLMNPKAKYYFYVSMITRKGKIKPITYSNMIEVDKTYKEFI
jgi:hypothetical protein